MREVRVECFVLREESGVVVESALRILKWWMVCADRCHERENVKEGRVRGKGVHRF